MRFTKRLVRQKSISTLNLSLRKRMVFPITPITPPTQVQRENGSVGLYLRMSVWKNPKHPQPASFAIIAVFTKISKTSSGSVIFSCVSSSITVKRKQVIVKHNYCFFLEVRQAPITQNAKTFYIVWRSYNRICYCFFVLFFLTFRNENVYKVWQQFSGRYTITPAPR